MAGAYALRGRRTEARGTSTTAKVEARGTDGLFDEIKVTGRGGGVQAWGGREA